MNNQTEDWAYIDNPNRMYQHIPAKFLLTAARQTQKENEE